MELHTSMAEISAGPLPSLTPPAEPQPLPLAPPPESPPAPLFSPAPGESPDAFAAFLVYFQLPGKRRLTAVARATGAGLRTVYRWAHDFDWAGRLCRHHAGLLQQRAQADADLARGESLAWSDRAAVIREREWEITDDLFEALQRRLSAADLDPAALAAFARTFALTSKIGRLATGLTPQAQDDHDAPDPLDREFEAALQTACRHRPPTPAAEPVPQP